MNFEKAEPYLNRHEYRIRTHSNRNIEHGTEILIKVLSAELNVYLLFAVHNY